MMGISEEMQPSQDNNIYDNVIGNVKPSQYDDGMFLFHDITSFFHHWNDSNGHHPSPNSQKFQLFSGWGIVIIRPDNCELLLALLNHNGNSYSYNWDIMKRTRYI
jgi:hypothetical protein